MIKKYFILFSFLFLIASSAHAESVVITPFIGYGIGGQFEETTTESTLELDESSLYGLSVNFNAPQGGQYEIFYSRQETTLTSGGFAPRSALFDMDINYLHIGGTVAYGYDWIKPFIVGTLGITYFDPGPSEYTEKTCFSFCLGGGLKFILTDNIGIRMEARGFGTLFNSTIWFVGDSEGAYFGVTGDAIWQFQLNVGLMLAF